MANLFIRRVSVSEGGIDRTKLMLLAQLPGDALNLPEMSEDVLNSDYFGNLVFSENPIYGCTVDIQIGSSVVETLNLKPEDILLNTYRDASGGNLDLDKIVGTRTPLLFNKRFIENS